MKSTDPDYVFFAEISHGPNGCGMQSQYCSRYVGGWKDIPDLSQGLRFKQYKPYGGDESVNQADYHNILLHKDDVAEFVKRVTDYRRATYQIP